MITFLIIIVTVGASLYAWKNPDVYRKWIMNPYLVSKDNQYMRFITSGLIHADQMHLFVNMLSFYFFGRFLESWFEYRFGNLGPLVFLGFYLLGIIISEIPTFLKHRNNYNYNSLGASGAVSAVIFAFAILRPTDLIYIFFVLPIPAFIYGFLFIVYSYWASYNQNDQINHDAHFYGAVFGLLFIVIVSPEVINEFFAQIANWL